MLSFQPVKTGVTFHLIGVFVREINSLHDTTDTVRFATLQCFTPQELYYIMVLGEEEIYTSSFLGTFKRMMGKMQPQTGSEFLDSLHHDYFRIFLKLCAGYNTLSAFLATMPDKDRVALITRFMANLQAGKEDSPEEAVDVADALGSINDTTLLIFLKQKIAENYIIADSLNSKKGRVIYALLDRMINLPQPDSVYARLTKPNLLLPNIKEMYYGALMNDSGMIYQQVFFFGDEDGQHSYEHFLDNFKNDPNWQINNSNKYWTSITAKKPHKITIYANNPLPEPEDDEAIARLCKFLADTGIVPTIVIHRGHSYHLPLTLTHLQSKNRIVILGYCGGYQNLTTVIGKAPDAQIVSSKQTGTMGVNDEILRFLNRCLLNGEDIKWADMWHNLEIEFNKKQNLFQKDKFTDYVPPHKNLGALFIKAYRNSMNAPE